MKRKGLKDYKQGDAYILNPGMIPTTSELKYGEMAVDIDEGILYVSDQQKVTAIGSGFNLDVQHANGKTATISGAGNYGDTLKVDVNVSTNIDNQLEVRNDGLYVPESTVSTEDSSTIYFDGNGTEDDKLTANVKISTEVNNRIEVKSDGLYISGITNIIGEDAVHVETTTTSTEISLTINPNDKILTQDIDGLLSTLSLQRQSSPSSDEYAASYILVGSDGITALGATIDIPKDQLLEDAYYNSTTHMLTLVVYLSDGTTKDIDVDLTGLVDVYTASNGVKIVGIDIQGEVDPTGEFLSVGSNGFKVSGISSAINTAVSVETTRSTDVENDLQQQINDVSGAFVKLKSNTTQTIDSDIALDKGKELLGTNEDGTQHVIGAIKTYQEEQVISLEDVTVGMNLRGKTIAFDTSKNPVFGVGIINGLVCTVPERPATPLTGFLNIFSDVSIISSTNIFLQPTMFTDGTWKNNIFIVRGDYDVIVVENNLKNAFNVTSPWTFKDTSLPMEVEFTQNELGNEVNHTNINSKDRPTVETSEGKKKVAYLEDIPNAEGLDATLKVGNTSTESIVIVNEYGDRVAYINQHGDASVKVSTIENDSKESYTEISFSGIYCAYDYDKNTDEVQSSISIDPYSNVIVNNSSTHRNTFSDKFIQIENFNNPSNDIFISSETGYLDGNINYNGNAIQGYPVLSANPNRIISEEDAQTMREKLLIKASSEITLDEVCKNGNTTEEQIIVLQEDSHTFPANNRTTTNKRKIILNNDKDNIWLEHKLNSIKDDIEVDNSDNSLEINPSGFIEFLHSRKTHNDSGNLIDDVIYNCKLTNFEEGYQTSKKDNLNNISNTVRLDYNGLYIDHTNNNLGSQNIIELTHGRLSLTNNDSNGTKIVELLNDEIAGDGRFGIMVHGYSSLSACPEQLLQDEEAAEMRNKLKIPKNHTFTLNVEEWDLENNNYNLTIDGIYDIDMVDFGLPTFTTLENRALFAEANITPVSYVDNGDNQFTITLVCENIPTENIQIQFKY